jgi:hypothetical protein
MILRKIGCRRFRKLIHERDDRVLDRQEQLFVHKHRTACPGCRTIEKSHSLALDMLRSAALDSEPGVQFEERVIRRLKVQHVRESIGYWSPAIAGASLACLALFAALTLMGKPQQLKQADFPAGEARLDPHRVFPDLELRETNRFIR